tara:strand:- start:1403 stop:1660 length:258 start_codon:yes stop_codon:yes gene_type:complete
MYLIKDVNGHTALHSAAAAGSPEWTRWLIRNDCDVKLTSKDGETALHVAASQGENNDVFVKKEYTYVFVCIYEFPITDTRAFFDM